VNLRLLEGSYTNTKTERRSEDKNMIILWYFNWRTAPGEDKRKGLKEIYEKVKKAFEKTDVKFLGPYGPLNERWNYVWMFEAESFDKYMEVRMKLGPAPKEITNHVHKLLFPDQF